MRKLVIIAAVGVLLPATGLGGAWWFGAFDSNLVVACETAIKERLRSPRSYRRIEITESQQHLSVEEYRAYQAEHRPDVSPIVMQADESGITSGDFPFTVDGMWIEYEAQNAYGTMIRNRAHCETDLNPESVSASHVRIDGKSELDLLVERTLGQRQRE